MVEAIKDFIVAVFGQNAWIGIIIISMLPIVELRGAIPFALGSAWGTFKLSPICAYFCSVVGATLPALLIIPLLKPVFNWMKKTKFFKKIATFFDERFSKKSEKIADGITETNQKKRELKKFLGVVAFVAVPLPLTGAWTGSAVSAYLNMNYFKGVLAVFLGNIISGAIMLGLCLMFPNFVDGILNCFLALVVFVLLIMAVLSLFKKNEKKDTSV